MLFHMARGTDIRGMRGILPVSDGKIRPLLCVGKQDILDEMRRRGQSWCEDASNGDTAYARNRLRQNVLPELCEVNAKAIRHIGILAEEMAETEDYLQQQTKEAYAAVCLRETENRTELDAARLNELPRVLGRRVLYEAFGRVAPVKDLTCGHVEDMLWLTGKEGTKYLDLPHEVKGMLSYGTFCLEKNREETSPVREVSDEAGEMPAVFFLKDLEKAPASVHTEGGTVRLWVEKARVPKEEEFKKNFTKYLNCDMIKDSVAVRTMEAGDRIRVREDGSHQSLRQFFINTKVARQAREKTVLVAAGNEILLVVGMRQAAGTFITEHTQKMLVVEYVADATREEK